MPSAQVIDLNPLPRTEETILEKTVGGFAKRHRENQIDQQETDALKDIYGQYQQDGQNLERAIQAVQTRPGLSPTTRVNTVKQLMDFQKYNGELQKKAKEEASNKAKVADLERRRNLPPGSLAPYEDDPKMAEQITRPPKEGKKTQASQPIDEDQLRRIQHVESNPEFESASLPKKGKMLRDSGVSKENADSVLKPYAEEAKIDDQRGKVLREGQAKADLAFVEEQTAKAPELAARQHVQEQAAILNEQGVTGDPWDQAMQKLGLLQYTSDGYRVFTSLAKDAVKNQNIKSVIGSQISQMEFGFFRDATINPNFSKEANRQILKKEGLALRYEKLYADITKKKIQENNGQIPERIQAQVNEEFAKQAEKISKEVREAAIDFQAIQHVPKGKVLMYDKKRRPLHVPANEVEKYSKPPYGATLS